MCISTHSSQRHLCPPPPPLLKLGRSLLQHLPLQLSLLPVIFASLHSSDDLLCFWDLSQNPQSQPLIFLINYLLFQSPSTGSVSLSLILAFIIPFTMIINTYAYTFMVCILLGNKALTQYLAEKALQCLLKMKG